MDDYYSINVNQIQQQRHNRDRVKFSTYKKILERCYLKIKSCAETEATYCSFTIPEYIFGEPLFNAAICSDFMVQHLMDNGFSAKFINPCYIFVCWNYGDTKKYDGFRKTNKKYEKIKPKMITYNKNPVKVNNISIDTTPQEKYRFINEYVPVKGLLYKNK